MSGPVTLEGPYFNTINWDKDHNGIHPVEMLARIAKFENKVEAKYDVCRREVINRNPSNDYKKLVVCSYDNFECFGNGKLEKQAKLVAARNMICKIKTKNIGIVNETLAAGVTIEKSVDTDPHKKPIIRQFKNFTSGGSLSTMSNFRSAGTLGSFVPSTASQVSPPSELTEIIKPPISGSVISEIDKEEIEQYKAYIEGKVESPSDKIPAQQETESTATLPVTKPKIVFKRSADTDSNDQIQPDKKKPRENESQQEPNWDSSNYGYQQPPTQQIGRGRGYYGGYNRGSRGYSYGYGGGYWF